MLYMSELREYGEYLRDREMSENTGSIMNVGVC